MGIQEIFKSSEIKTNGFSHTQTTMGVGLLVDDDLAKYTDGRKTLVRITRLGKSAVKIGFGTYLNKIKNIEEKKEKILDYQYINLVDYKRDRKIGIIIAVITIIIAILGLIF